MATRDLKVTIDAEAAKFEAGMERVRRSTMRMEDQLRKADLAAASLDKQLADEAAKAAQKRAADMEKLGRGLVVFGAATLAGLGMATKAAIDWESAWAGVRKTVDGSPEEMAALESELRELATTLPATHAEIAGVAEAAGQLGVGVNDVAKFTKVMIDLGETTNLSASDAATALARMANIMGTATSDVDRMGSTIVELGNNSATTEAEIVTLATRLAAAGKMAGLSEADVFAFASTLTSVGVEAEAGGTALSKVFTAISDSVIDSNEDLQVFAEVAGVTADEFRAAFEDNAAGAIDMFISGLGRMQESGQSTSAVFDELGLKDQRLMRALLSTASAGSLLGDQIAMANEAWDENTALVEEAAQRYETSEAKIQIARNALVDLAIDIGGVLLPHLVTLVETGTSVLKWFTDLPGPVKTAATVLGGLVGTVALLGGGFLLLAPRLAAAHSIMLTMARTSPVLAGGLLYLGQAAARLTMFGAIAGGIYALFEATKEAAPSVDQATQSLLNFDDASKQVALDQLLRQVEDVREFGGRSMFKVATDSLFGFGAANLQGAQDIDEFKDSLESFDQAIASMVQSGNLDLAKESAQRLFDALGIEGEFDELVERKLPAYAEALIAADNQQKITGESATGLAGELDGAGESADEAEKQLKEYLDLLKAATDPVFALNAAVEGVTDAQTAYNEAVAEHGPKSVEAQSAAFDLASAVADLEAKALDGQLSFSEFSGKLDQWVKQGAITKSQANAIRDRVKDLTGAAEDYQDDYSATLKVWDQATGRINGVLGKLAELNGTTATATTNFVSVFTRTYETHGTPFLSGRATGGSIRGPGTETSDSIPMMLSHNEHVLSAREVRGLGGHNAVEQMRAAARTGPLAQPTPMFATTPSTVSHPVSSAKSSAPQTLDLRITGNGPLFEQINKGVRNGQIQLRTDPGGGKVRVG